MSGRIFGVQKYLGLKNREWVILMLIGSQSVFGPRCWKHRLSKILFIISLSHRDALFKFLFFKAKILRQPRLLGFEYHLLPTPLPQLSLSTRFVPFSLFLSYTPPAAHFPGCVSKTTASLVYLAMGNAVIGFKQATWASMNFFFHV